MYWFIDYCIRLYVCTLYCCPFLVLWYLLMAVLLSCMNFLYVFFFFKRCWLSFTFNHCLFGAHWFISSIWLRSWNGCWGGKCMQMSGHEEVRKMKGITDSGIRVRMEMGSTVMRMRCILKLRGMQTLCILASLEHRMGGGGVCLHGALWDYQCIRIPLPCTGRSSSGAMPLPRYRLLITCYHSVPLK